MFDFTAKCGPFVMIGKMGIHLTMLPEKRGLYKNNFLVQCFGVNANAT